MSSPFQLFLSFSGIGLLLFLVLVVLLPHSENREQVHRWKISILYAVGSFLLWPLIMTVMYAYEIFTTSPSRPISNVVLSTITGALLPGSCIGIYFAIFIFLMFYWKMRTAPWSSLDSEAGASTFDTIVNFFRRIVRWFRRAG